MSNANKALGLSFLSLIAFSIMGLLVKYGQQFTSLWMIIFLRSIFSMALLAPSVLRLRPFLGNNRLLLTFRGIAGFFANVTGFYALGHMALVDATLIIQISPLFILIFSHFFLDEKITYKEVLLMLVGFAGVSLVIKPDFQTIPYPALAALAAAVFMGAAHTSIRALRHTDRSSVIVLYYTFAIFIGSLPGVLYLGVLPDGHSVLIILGISISGTLGQTLTTVAYRLHRAGNVAMIRYLGIPISGLWGYIAFSEIPDFWSVTGIVIILLALILMEVVSQKREKHIAAKMSADYVQET